jgi:AraC-like DNA-binding protein
VLAGEVVDAETAHHFRMRTMPAYVVSVVTSGSGSYAAEDGQVRPIDAGTVTLVHPGHPHWYGTAPGGRWSEVFAVFAGPLFDTLAEVGVLPPDGPRTPSPSAPAAALRAVLRSAPTTSAAAERQLLALADWLADVNPGTDPARSPEVAAAVDLLTGDLTGVLDLATIARRVALPSDALRRRFAAEVGQPPMSFRNAHRLQTAATLLRSTDVTLRSLARTLGYSDQFHLSRRFKAHFGVSPRDYRNSRGTTPGS